MNPITKTEVLELQREAFKKIQEAEERITEPIITEHLEWALRFMRQYENKNRKLI